MEDFLILDPDPYNNSTGSASLMAGPTASVEPLCAGHRLDILWSGAHSHWGVPNHAPEKI